MTTQSTPRWKRCRILDNEGKPLTVWRRGPYAIARSVAVEVPTSEGGARSEWRFEAWREDGGREEWIPRLSAERAANDPDNTFATLEEAKLACALHATRARRQRQTTSAV